ncbi:MAG: hypothetical protein PHF84_04145 [bacterium]|nr:hypothetical protein [bacterium]
MLDFPLNFIKYIWYVLTTSYRYGMAIKPYPNTLLPLLLKKLFAPVVNIVDIDDIDFGYRKGIVSFLSRYMQKPFPRFFDRITYHNALLKKFILKEYRVKENRLLVLKQGVDLKLFHPASKNEKMKKKFISFFKLKPDVRILIYTAHLNIASDLDILFRHIRPVLSENTYLIIAGGGPLLQYFKDLVRSLKLPSLYFTGYLTPEKIIPYIVLSDYALVYYQDKEVNYYRSSMKLREYLALKKKIISNDVGELRLFRPFTYQSRSDIHDYISLIKKLLRSRPKDRREEKGYVYVRKHYDWDKITEQFVKQLDHVV